MRTILELFHLDLNNGGSDIHRFSYKSRDYATSCWKMWTIITTFSSSIKEAMTVKHLEVAQFLPNFNPLKHNLHKLFICKL